MIVPASDAAWRVRATTDDASPSPSLPSPRSERTSSWSSYVLRAADAAGSANFWHGSSVRAAGGRLMQRASRDALAAGRTRNAY